MQNASFFYCQDNTLMFSITDTSGYVYRTLRNIPYGIGLIAPKSETLETILPKLHERVTSDLNREEITQLEPAACVVAKHFTMLNPEGPSEGLDEGLFVLGVSVETGEVGVLVVRSVTGHGGMIDLIPPSLVQGAVAGNESPFPNLLVVDQALQHAAQRAEHGPQVYDSGWSMFEEYWFLLRNQVRGDRKPFLAADILEDAIHLTHINARWRHFVQRDGPASAHTVVITGTEPLQERHIDLRDEHKERRLSEPMVTNQLM